MFGDEDEDLLEEVVWALGTYTVDDILEHNDMTIEDALTILLREGFITLPETRPV